MVTRTKAQDMPVELVAKAPFIYKVKMATTFIVPAEKGEIDELRAWHALPTLRPWSMVSANFGASGIAWSSGGSQQYEKEHDSHHVFWRHAGNLEPGTKFEFTSEFTVHSVQRDVDLDKVKVKWEDYGQPLNDPSAKVDVALVETIHPEIAAAADKIKKSTQPAQAIPEFCSWIGKKLTYDAGVPYPSEDVTSVLKNCRGHCGHHFAVFEQFCIQTGIPVRRVFGLNLYQPNGKGDLHAIRTDWTNVHTWAEVFFPGIGWIEVEPSSGERAYAIPASWVQNNKWFGNYALWFRDKGEQKTPTWTFKDGRFISDYGVEHIITYTEERASASENAKPLLPASAVWTMRWDLALDGELKNASEIQGHKLTVRNNRIVMNAGEIIGEIVDGKFPIVTLRQDHARGFIAFYIGKRTMEGHIEGTWFNTFGQSGDFDLILEK